eukprot:11227402-Lingulodinium_polyedra.AAC.1
MKSDLVARFVCAIVKETKATDLNLAGRRRLPEHYGVADVGRRLGGICEGLRFDARFCRRVARPPDGQLSGQGVVQYS